MTHLLDDSAVRCPRCAKRMQVDLGADDDAEYRTVQAVYSCPSCGHSVRDTEAARPWTQAEIRRRIAIVRHQLYGDPHPDHIEPDGSILIPLQLEPAEVSI